MSGLMVTHGAAALVSLNATQFEIALFGSLPLVLSAAIQLGVPYISAYITSRKALIIVSVWTQTFFTVLVGLSGYYIPQLAPHMFVIFFTLYATTGSLGAGVWTSWMADLVPDDIRGRYFAWRNTYLSIIQVSVGIVSGMLMQYYAGPQPGWLVFMVVFMISAVSRFFSGIMLLRQYEPPLTYKPVAKDFTYMEFLLKAPTSNFARFTLFIALVHGATAIAGPFFSPYFLKDLQMPYLDYSLVSNANLVGMLIFLPFWGRIADKYGNWFVLKVSAFGIALVPIPYMFLYSFNAMWILGFGAGVLWSAFGLSSFNYLLDAVTPQRRIRCSAYMTATIGFSVFLFGMSGGWIIYHLQPLWFWHSSYQTLFLISTAMRLGVVIPFVGFGLVREIREVHPLHFGDVMSQFPGVQLSTGMVRNVFRALRRI